MRPATATGFSTPKSTLSGFTLVEMMTVIAICTILVAILMPCLVTAKAKAKQATCTSNLRQIGIATRMYAEDWDERWPAADFMYPGPNCRPYCRNAPRKTFWAEVIFPYLRCKGVFLCPERCMAAYGRTDFDDPAPWVRGAQNSYAWNRGLDCERTARTEGLICVMDGWSYEAGPELDVATRSAWFWGRWTIADRHTGLCNVLWTDGHVKSVDVASIWAQHKSWVDVSTWTPIDPWHRLPTNSGSE